MAALTTNTIDRSLQTDNTLMQAADAGDDTFVNSQVDLLAIKNGQGSPITVTIVTPNTVDGNAVSELQHSIPAGETLYLAAFRISTYGNPVTIQYSSVTSVTVGVMKLGKAG